MLIRALRAENFMRFSELRLTGFPLEGVVAIEGPNESGKSSIGEAILFAFFGRTRDIRDAPVTELIRWGADSLRVEVEFSLGTSQGASPVGDSPGYVGPIEDYLIYREVDRRGTNYVKVLSLPEREEVATGIANVEAFLARRVGFNFGEFHHSFYHDQHDAREPGAKRLAFFDQATGLTHMRAARADLEQEIVQFERQFAYYQKEIGRNAEQVQKHQRNVEKLDTLRDRQEKADAELRALKDRLLDLERRRREAGASRDRNDKILRRLEETANGKADSFLTALSDVLDASRRDPTDARGREAQTSALSESARKKGERVQELMRDVTDLVRLCRDQQEELNQSLAESDTAGPATESVRVRASMELLEKRQRGQGLWVGFLLSVTVVCFLATAFLLPDVIPLERFLSDSPDAGWRKLQTRLLETRPAIPWTTGSLGVFALLAAVWLWARRASSRSGLRQAVQAEEMLSAEVARLKETRARLERCVDGAGVRNAKETVEQAASCGPSLVSRRAEELRKKYASLQAPDSAQLVDGLLAEVKKSRQRSRSEADQAVARFEKEKRGSEATVKKLEGDKDRVQRETRECESHAAKGGSLEEKNRELQAEADKVREEIDLCLEASRLLQETESSVARRMGSSLASFARGVLPRLTSGRYSDVKLDADSQLQVYSQEKGDFLSLRELSGGTNEALALALRLSLAQILVNSRKLGVQFVLLDEPFKMMDPERILGTLQTLRQLSPDLTQFLVIQPRFGDVERAGVDSVISTNPANTRLEADAGAAPRSHGA